MRLLYELSNLPDCVYFSVMRGDTYSYCGHCNDMQIVYVTSHTIANIFLKRTSVLLFQMITLNYLPLYRIFCFFDLYLYFTLVRKGPN